jgi:Tfp pilus assembly protein PilF
MTTAFSPFVRLVLAFSIAACSSAPRRAQMNPAAEAHLRKARDWVVAGQDRKAIAEYSKALRLDKTSVPLNVEAGILYLKFKNYYSAEPCFQAAANEEPENHEHFVHLGQAQNGLISSSLLSHRVTMVEKAFSSFSTALRLRPDSRDARIGRAVAAMGNKSNFPQALEDLRIVLEKDTTDAEAYFLRGVYALTIAGDEASGFADIRKARKLNPKEGKYGHFMGRYVQAKRNRDPSQEALGILIGVMAIKLIFDGMGEASGD